MQNSLLTPSHQLPLNGKRILVTAPRNYAARLTQEIISYGGLPVMMPTIETCLLENYTELDQVLRQINSFHWLAFTSRNGIEAVCQRLATLNIPLSILEQCVVCALGKDADRLRQLGVKVDLVPNEASPQGLIEQLAATSELSQQKILVPVPQVVGIPEPNIIPQFVTGLESLGLQVTRVSAYTTRCFSAHLYPVELNLVRNGNIDVIAFSSTAEVSAFLQMVDEPKDYQDCAICEGGRYAIACFGPYTAANARDLGLEVDIVAEDFSSFKGFAKAMGEFFSAS